MGTIKWGPKGNDMGYQDKICSGMKINPLDNDFGDEVELTEEEEFELLRDSGMKPEEFTNAREGARYAAWIATGRLEATEQTPT